MLLETYVHVLINVIFSVNVVLGTLFVKQRTQDLTCGNSSTLTDLGAVGNAIACSRTCSSVNGCQGFYFNEDDGACWGSNQTECQTVPSTVFYRKANNGNQQAPGCASPGGCPPGWSQICSSCYIIAGNSSITLLGIKTFCQTTYPNYNAYMVQLETAEEDVAVVTNIVQNTASFCLGVHDDLSIGDYRWMSTNAPVTYSNWLPGQPDSMGQRYVQVMSADNYQWRDNGDGVACQPICEISLQ